MAHYIHFYGQSLLQLNNISTFSEPCHYTKCGDDLICKDGDCIPKGNAIEDNSCKLTGSTFMRAILNDVA